MRDTLQRTVGGPLQHIRRLRLKGLVSELAPLLARTPCLDVLTLEVDGQFPEIKQAIRHLADLKQLQFILTATTSVSFSLEHDLIPLASALPGLQRLCIDCSDLTSTVPFSPCTDEQVLSFFGALPKLRYCKLDFDTEDEMLDGAVARNLPTIQKLCPDLADLEVECFWPFPRRGSREAEAIEVNTDVRTLEKDAGNVVLFYSCSEVRILPSICTGSASLVNGIAEHSILWNNKEEEKDHKSNEFEQRNWVKSHGIDYVLCRMFRDQERTYGLDHQ
ncbi:hypothetical protein ANO11243_084340 [Dothideomycetidae sp. 11243]|nr:hypothetical protein ANO11243_084340 [fungal sp. No.11243]